MAIEPNIIIKEELYQFAEILFPITRSITGNGVRETLKIIKEKIAPPKMFNIYEVPTGTRVFDWTVPKEWNINDAYVLDEKGNKIIDFKKNNLHVVGYSVPVNKKVTFTELQEHLYSLEQKPDAIPYITSYYRERWGFCISHKDRLKLKEGIYTVVIDSTLSDGSLTYGELIIPGSSAKEVFLSTYVCHPSLGNNEVSGPVVTTYLAQFILSQPRKYTYRIVFIPETIGSITYVSKFLSELRKNVIAGFNITCVGDERTYSFLPSRKGDTLADRAALAILNSEYPNCIHYSFLDRGSDERQYCSPGVDLPIVSIMRSKYGTYLEYHTSLDNLEFITPEGLFGGFKVLQKCIQLIEYNAYFKTTCLCEPQLGKRGLYSTLGTGTSPEDVRNMLDFLVYADGTNDFITISNTINVAPNKLYPLVSKLKEAGLIEESHIPIIK